MLIENDENNENDFERDVLPSVFEYFKSFGWVVNHSELTMEFVQNFQNKVEIQSYCDFYPEEQQLYVAFEVYMPYPFSTEACQFLHHLGATLKNVSKFEFDYDYPTAFSLAWALDYSDIFLVEEEVTFSHAIDSYIIFGNNFIYSCINSLTAYSRLSRRGEKLPRHVTPSHQTAFCTLDFLKPADVH